MVQPLSVISFSREESFLEISGARQGYGKRVSEIWPRCIGTCSPLESIQVRETKGMEVEISLMCLGKYWGGHGNKYVEQKNIWLNCKMSSRIMENLGQAKKMRWNVVGLKGHQKGCAQALFQEDQYGNCRLSLFKESETGSREINYCLQ